MAWGAFVNTINITQRAGINIKLVSSKSTRDTSKEIDKSTSIGEATKTKKNRGLKIAISVLVTILVIAGGIFAFAAWVANDSDTIHPNISIYGIDLGGLTLEKAKAVLKTTTWNEYTDAEVNVSFPAGITLTVKAAESGLVIDPEKDAQMAFNYGRDGNLFSNTFSFISCILVPKELSIDVSSRLDEEHIKELIAETSRKVDAKLLESALRITDENISIVKGASSVMVNDDEIFRLIKEAFIKKDYDIIEYVPSDGEPREIDLEELKKIIYIEPKNAEYDEKFNVSEHVTGVSFDEELARKRLNEAKKGDTVVIPLIYTEPEFTKEELEGLLFRDVLHSKTTSLTANEVRSKNVELAAKAVDGTIIYPGETFSFNDTVGKRTAEKGYGPAAAYLNGEVVQEIGGGICQVSSVIYYCCLYADLEIVYRTGHLYAASYLPLGMDATVSWGGPDFQFKNNTDYPIKIHAWRDGSTVSAELYGTKLDDTYIVMDYVVTATIPYETKYKENPSIAPGQKKIEQYGSNGYRVDTYKYKYNGDGSLISKTYEAYSGYAPHHEVYLVAPGELYNYVSPPPGTETPTPSQEPTPTPEPTPDDLTPEPTEPPAFDPEPTAAW